MVRMDRSMHFSTLPMKFKKEGEGKMIPSIKIKIFLAFLNEM